MILVYFTVGSTSSGSAFVIAPKLGAQNYLWVDLTLKTTPPPIFLDPVLWSDQRYFCTTTLTWINYLETWLRSDNTSCYFINHIRYLSHLALQVGFSNWVHKTQIHSIQRWHHFCTKTSRSTLAAPPLFILDLVFLIQIDYHSVLYILVS